MLGELQRRVLATLWELGLDTFRVDQVYWAMLARGHPVKRRGVREAIRRLAARGFLRRVSRGVYELTDLGRDIAESCHRLYVMSAMSKAVPWPRGWGALIMRVCGKLRGSGEDACFEIVEWVRHGGEPLLTDLTDLEEQ